ncbi:MaoC/PaaZ C-terminal domain-containing protein [Kineococcus gynurae]|uniref:MaoC/PaaZ C-terminal domain-containing protein n=1 Tax=Kineococcus gynurae TaxID=452979 RepID=A0ABV5LTH7_9ACTN
MSAEAGPARTFESLAVGDALPVVEQRLTRADLKAYADASGDQNPIHQDEAVATSVGLPDVIAHGMLTMGLAGSAVEAWAGAGADAVQSFTTKFTAPVVVPAGVEAVVSIGGSVTALDADARTATVEVSVTHEGAKVLGRARAVVRFA